MDRSSRSRGRSLLWRPGTNLSLIMRSLPLKTMAVFALVRVAHLADPNSVAEQKSEEWPGSLLRPLEDVHPPIV